MGEAFRPKPIKPGLVPQSSALSPLPLARFVSSAPSAGAPEMPLTKKQTEELNKAIVAYLREQGHNDAAAAVEKDTQCAPDASSASLLEKKWTAVLRLQKKVQDLEARCKQLEEDGGGMRRKRDAGDGLPRAPHTHTLAGHRSPVTAVAFHPKYTQLASSSEDATVRVWDYESGEYERTLKGHTNAVQDVVFSPAGDLLASCSADLSIKLWDADTWDCKRTLHGHDHNVSSLAFTPNGETLLSASRDKTIRVWEVSTGYCTRTLKGHEEWVRRVRVEPQGALLASCSNDQTARIWNMQKGEAVHVLRDHSHVVECIAWSSEVAASSSSSSSALTAASSSSEAGVLLATGGRDKMIFVYDVATGQRVHSLRFGELGSRVDLPSE